MNEAPRAPSCVKSLTARATPAGGVPGRAESVGPQAPPRSPGRDARGGELFGPREGSSRRPSLRDVYLLFRPRVAYEDGQRADAQHHEAPDGLPKVRRVPLRVGRRGEQVELPDGEAQ